MTSEARRKQGRGRLAGPAMVAIVVSILLTITIGLLGPSAMVPALTGPAWQPPYSLAAHPSPYLVIALATATLLLGGLGLLAALFATSRPGSPPATTRDDPDATPTATPDDPDHGSGGAAFRRPYPAPLHRLGGVLLSARALVLVGCAAAAVLAFLPPSGSGDHLNYAAYGRMVTLGVDPYTHGAIDLPGDPIADAVEEPWREEPSVYGPVATAVQAVASWIGGDSLRLTMFVLALSNAAAFIVTGLLVDRFTRHDPRRRLRAALLWTANPLLLYHLVAGMHVDTLAIACMVAALLARGRPMGSGVLLGLGVAIKVNAGLVALGPAWELRRRPGRLALMAGCAVAVVVVGYAVVGFDALAPITRTSKSISHASFWKLVQGWLQAIVGTGSAYRGAIQVGSLLVLALVAWSLLRLAARAGWSSGGGALSGHPGAPSWHASSAAPGGVDAPVVAMALVVAYLFATPYILPWYDGLALGMLALVGASALDGLVVAHLLVLSLAYLPARVEGQPDDLEWLRTVVRPQLGWALLALTVALVAWAWRAAGRERRRQASAAPQRSGP
ncbi:polyprenol phosphomannose-dependent alpha 1,6 mannosyltransferase MptB [Nonomuraea sp. NPDC049419]|uniref:polyprenol phosphomannose-dependent alpha 1,6 mannosyltransferase MptB n=1 Tax=Nonomuraea sp. NPDC049419 TaxID=3155772 RepID=UPI00342A3E0A